MIFLVSLPRKKHHGMKRNPLIQFRNVPVSGAMLETVYKELKAPDKKLQNLTESGELIRLKRGLYLVNPELSGEKSSLPLCANHIWMPSYLSLRWALRWYGLIPERVYRITSVTTKRTQSFETPIGVFDYYQVKGNYFRIGIRTVKEDTVCFLIASPEKALCDLILFDTYVPNRSIKRLRQYLEEDMRFDMDELSHFDPNIIEDCAKQGFKTNIFNNLIKIIKS